ncbi:short-chain dehydrogenase [Labilithrix luteola]|uniref:Short-chain dehydrogenase n=1 Tax=Labilithrix luteola TaxID=1391654 RepID=A0A0K1Q433_9BACT|nr:SDR family oxidoreductase [Labilithrix luteola]AKV00591.1 short-chain dehydrogenase [Labilithrix luteola]
MSNPKTLLVTGASSGIGKATARLFAEHGWNVVATMRKPEASEPLGPPERVWTTRLDVQDRDSIAAAVSGGLERFGSIDALVNNAGYGLYGLFETIPREKILEQFEVNVFGVMELTRALLPHFRQSGGGTIVNVSSGAGMFTLPMLSLYCASKFALEGFTEALAYEAASQNVAVKLVIPHGGVSSTRFGERSAQEAQEQVGEQDSSNEAIQRDYAAFVDATNASFAAMRSEISMSSLDVARVIFEAVTDGKDQLRYLVGGDERGFVKARREFTERDYVAFMRSRFPTPKRERS